MTKSLTTEQRALRRELVYMVAQGIRTRAERDNKYSPEQVEYLTQQLDRVAKFLCLKD